MLLSSLLQMSSWKEPQREYFSTCVQMASTGDNVHVLKVREYLWSVSLLRSDKINVECFFTDFPVEFEVSVSVSEPRRSFYQQMDESGY
uniref:Uncharacterized protein n=1 Tax=Trichuris muris TaxID=70415 RepID=A0A5S6PZ85_TRIMR